MSPRLVETFISILMYISFAYRMPLRIISDRRGILFSEPRVDLYIFHSLFPRANHATAEIAKAYSDRMTIAFASGAYIVLTVRFTRPVAKFA